MDYSRLLRYTVMCGLIAASFVHPAHAQSAAAIQQAEKDLEEGRKQLDKSHLAQAEAAFTHASSISPRDPRSFFYLAVLKDQSGDSDAAIKLYAQALDRTKDLGMDSAELRSNLGNTLLKTNYIEQAIYDFKRALEIDPSCSSARLGLTHAYLDSGEYAAALQELQNGTDHAMVDPSVPFLRACALKGLGRTVEARSLLLQYERGVNGAGSELLDAAGRLLKTLPAPDRAAR